MVNSQGTVFKSDAASRFSFDVGNFCHVEGAKITLKEDGQRTVKRLEACKDYIIEGALNAYYAANITLRILFNFIEQAGRALDISRVVVLLYLPHACSRLKAVLATYADKTTKWFRVSQLVGDITFSSIVGSYGFAHIFLGKGDLLQGPLNYVFGIGTAFRVLQLGMVRNRFKMVTEMDKRLEEAKIANFSSENPENLLDEFTDEELMEFFYVTPKEVENLRETSNEIFQDDPTGANTRIYSHLKDRLGMVRKASRFETVAAAISLVAGILFVAVQFTPAGPVVNAIALLAYSLFAVSSIINVSEFVYTYNVVNSKLPKLRSDKSLLENS